MSAKAQEEGKRRREQLREIGHEVTSRWLDVDIIPVPDITMGTRPMLWGHALADMQDIRHCDLFVIDSTTPSTTGGYHVEFGWAMGLDKNCVLIGPMLNIFHTLAAVQIYDSWEAFTEALLNGKLEMRWG
jgi:hypothetical protein